MALDAGTAYLDVAPKLVSNFGRSLASQVQGPITKAGEQASHHFARSFGHGLGAVGKGIGAGIAGGLGLAVVAAVKLTPVLRESVQGYRDHLKVVAQTTAAIKSTGGAANVSVKQVGKLSDALERKTTVDGDVIQSGQNMLLTFKNVRNETGKGNDIFNQASATVLDMAAAFGHGQVSAAGVQQASIQLGKALNDPIAGMGALSRVGVTFTKQQKDQIKTLVESGHALAARKIILKELNSEFGGSAAAQATASGRMQVAWHQLQDVIGSVLLPVVDRFENSLGRKVIPDLNVLATRYGPAVQATLLRWIGSFTKLLPSTRELGFGITALGAAFSGEGITSSADSFVGKMERFGVTGRRVVDWAKNLRPELEHIGQSFGKLFQGASQAGPALQQAGGGGRVFANSLSIAAPVLDVVARNLHNVLPWLPAILAGFLAFRAVKGIVGPLAQLGGTISDFASPVLVVATFARARATKQLAAALREQTVSGLGAAGAQGIENAAGEVGLATTIRMRVATIAQAVAQRVVAVASKAWAAAQWLVNAALTASPVGLVIVAVAALAAGIVYAYKHSETFRKIVQAAFAAIKTVIGAAVGFIIGNFRAWWDIATTVVAGILHLFGKLPGPMGAPFRKAEEAVRSAKRTVDDQLDKIQRRVNRLTGKDIPVRVEGTVHWDRNAVLLKQVTGNFSHRAPVFGEGGMVTVGSGPTADDVWGRLSRGEFVVNAAAVARPGVRPALEALNARRFATGGFIDASRLPRLPGSTATTLGDATRSTLFGSSRLHGRDAMSVLVGLGLVPGVSGTVARVAQWTAAALGRAGEWAAWARRIMFESGGRWSAINRTDINWVLGHPSVGGAQVIAGTYAAYAGRFRNVGPFLYGVSVNPYANSYAGGNYAVHRYGSLAAVDPRVRPSGYDRGGFLPPGLSLAYNGTGRPEPVGRAASQPTQIVLEIDGRRFAAAVIDDLEAARIHRARLLP